MAIVQLGEAFRNLFAGRDRYPQFCKKGVRDRFTLTNDQFRVGGSRIRIPNLGWVCLRESLRFSGKILSTTISRVPDRWFASLNVDTPDTYHLPQAKNQGAVGVDLGVPAFTTLLTGESPVPGPKPHKALFKCQQRLSRSLSRKEKGSANRRKAKVKLARLHASISNLNVQGMLHNRHLARSIADMGFHECRRQLENKAEIRGGVVVVADRWFASSKTCSHCGHKLDSLPPSVREWVCPECDMNHHRDRNAAINLKNYAVSSTVSACGREGVGSGRKTRTKQAPVKQEVSTIATYE